MKITEQNFVQELKRQNESALEYVMTHYDGLVKSVAHRYLNVLSQYEEKCINDVFLAVWNHIDSFQPERNQKDISPYHSVIGSSFTKDGVTTTLNDVIWDDDVLLISYTMKIGKNSDFSIEKDNFVQLVDMYVNGKLLSDGSGGTSERIDDTTILCTEEIYIPDAVSLSGTQKMELEFSLADTDGRIASRLGRLDFSVSGDELKAATSTIDLDETYTLPNGETITFNRYTSNAINQKLYFSTTNDNCDYDIILKGKDNLGNPVEFYTSNLDAVAKVGKMVVDTSDHGYISDQASSLTLTPYVISSTNTNGETSDNYKPMGKAFTISLH